MIPPPRPRHRWRSALYAVAGALVVVVAALAFTALDRAAPARAQVDVSVDPAMTKGAATARVTIFEFSDYQ